MRRLDNTELSLAATSTANAKHFDFLSIVIALQSRLGSSAEVDPQPCA